MRAHFQYLCYVLKHKWFTFLECIKLGVPILGIVHDWSKFLPGEWFPYVHSFYNPDGSKKDIRDASGYFDPTALGIEFDRAWLHHQHLNKHHWQHWVLIKDEDKDVVLEMPLVYAKEMLADWKGAGKAQGNLDTWDWYLKHRTKMKLHPETKKWIEKQLWQRVEGPWKSC